MKVKRQSARYIVEGMDLFAKTIFQTDVEVSDISMSGASIRGRRRFAIGCKYLFKFEHKDRILSVKGAIAWAKLDGSEHTAQGDVVPIYSAGITFEDPSVEKAEQLREFIVDKIREMREHRLGGVKMKIHPPERAELHYLETSRVKDISLGGLRLETGRQPAVDLKFHLELTLSEKDQPLRCGGRIAYYQEMAGKAPKKFNVGLEFTEMAASDSEKLGHFITSLPSYNDR